MLSKLNGTCDRRDVDNVDLLPSDNGNRIRFVYLATLDESLSRKSNNYGQSVPPLIKQSTFLVVDPMGSEKRGARQGRKPVAVAAASGKWGVRPTISIVPRPTNRHARVTA